MASKNLRLYSRFFQKIILPATKTTMKNLVTSIEKLNPLFRYLQTRLAWLRQILRGLLSFLLQILLFQMNPFWIELGYFITISSLGFLAIKSVSSNKPTINSNSFSSSSPSSLITPKDADLFFTCVSAVTASSISILEMEAFSNSQLLVLTVIMFLSGEVFVSCVGLYLTRARLMKEQEEEKLARYKIHQSTSMEFDSWIELRIITQFGAEQVKPEPEPEVTDKGLRFKSIRSLAFLVSCYLVLVHVAGSVCVFVYISLVPSAKKVISQKGLNPETFAIFTTVSTFANCGFLPTNENMMVFRKNLGLLLVLIPQVLMGNALFPACLRFAILLLEKMTKKSEFRYMLDNSRELRYRHLFSGMHCVYLTGTTFGFIIVQLIVFCSLEWNSEVTLGLSGKQKLVESVFQVVNCRHAGESVFDLSAVSPAMLVLFVPMMYLPEYTSFLPIEEAEKFSTSEQVKNKSKKKDFWEHINFSQLCYLTIFTILICITERKQMKRDPLNFSVFNIVFEVISAYGNVGFSVGYSCERQINDDGYCKNAWYGFAGRWSDEGKFVLIVVMLFGRLKKFNMRGGRAWTLS